MLLPSKHTTSYWRWYDVVWTSTTLLQRWTTSCACGVRNTFRIRTLFPDQPGVSESHLDQNGARQTRTKHQFKQKLIKKATSCYSRGKSIEKITYTRQNSTKKIKKKSTIKSNNHEKIKKIKSVIKKSKKWFTPRCFQDIPPCSWVV